MIILGLDPSLSSSGYAFIEVDEDKLENFEPVFVDGLFDKEKDYKPKLLDYGVIETDSNNGLCERNYYQRKEMKLLIAEHEPDLISCEDQFGYLNTGTLKKLSHIRGNFMTLAEEFSVPFYIYSPRGVKKIVTGSGNAKKKEVVKSINDYYGLDLNKSQDNEADAIALALSYLIKEKKAKKI